MAHIRQEIDLILGQSDITWRQDDILAAPGLLGPKDGANLCSPNAQIDQFILNGGTGVSLTWLAVSGATYYVVQLCENSSFNGPTVKGYKVAAPITYFSLNFIEHVQLGETLYWRIMAFSATGAISSKSETRSFTYDCGDLGGNPENKTLGCEAYNIVMNITGPDTVHDGNQALYHLIIQWDCLGESESGDYTGEVALQSVEWSIEQSSRNPVSIACQSTGFMVADIQSSTSEMFTVKATATFAVGLATFTCSTHRDCTIDVESVSAGEVRHARILCSYGNSLYLIGFVDRVLQPYPRAARGDADGLGSGEGNGGNNNCEFAGPYPEMPSSSGDCTTAGLFHAWEYEWVESQDATRYAFATDIMRQYLQNAREAYQVGTDVLVVRVKQPNLSETSSSYSSSEFDGCRNTHEYSWWIIRADEMPKPIYLMKHNEDILEGDTALCKIYVYTGGLFGSEECIGQLYVTSRLADYSANQWAYVGEVNGNFEILNTKCVVASSSGS